MVDDDLSMREFLELMLTREGYEVDLAGGGVEALRLVKAQPYDLVITDIRMAGTDGIDVLRGVKEVHPDTVVVVISAFATAETAVLAMKEGAYDFIPKPFKIDELKAVVKSALDHRTPEAEKKVLEAKVKEGCQFGSLVGLSPPMLRVYDLVRRAAQTSTNIIISGESGTGKELVARAIHDNSPRAKERLMAINCGGMPEQLIESELFGYRKGAFTGATMDKPGLFELAHKGTIFLDELAELSLAMQVKLLRVVQDKTFRAVGDTKEHVLDVRFIAATNKDLESELMAGRFREDLYYRLNVINIHMPALRERKSDIPLLAQYFLNKYSQIMNKDVRKVSAYALDILSNYGFPGNVRELENIIERSVALEQSSIILPESLTLASFKEQRTLGQLTSEATPRSEIKAVPVHGPGLDRILGDLERLALAQALVAADGIRQKAAELLGITTYRLRSRLSRHDMNGLDRQHLEEIIRDTAELPGVPPDLAPRWDEQGFNLGALLLDVEKQLIEKALQTAGGSKTEAAALLGLTRRTLHHRLWKTSQDDAD